MRKQDLHCFNLSIKSGAVPKLQVSAQSAVGILFQHLRITLTHTQARTRAHTHAHTHMHTEKQNKLNKNKILFKASQLCSK